MVARVFPDRRKSPTAEKLAREARDVALTSPAIVDSSFTRSQTTVGSAGGASALPANPDGYIRLQVAGTEKVVPFYAQA